MPVKGRQISVRRARRIEQDGRYGTANGRPLHHPDQKSQDRQQGVIADTKHPDQHRQRQGHRKGAVQSGGCTDDDTNQQAGKNHRNRQPVKAAVACKENICDAADHIFKNEFHRGADLEFGVRGKQDIGQQLIKDQDHGGQHDHHGQHTDQPHPALSPGNQRDRH